MKETKQVNSINSQLPKSFNECGESPMLRDTSYELDKSRLNGMSFPQFPSLLRDCHEQQARPKQSPQELSTLSPSYIPIERSWSAPMQQKHSIEEKIDCGIDTIDYRFDPSNHSSKSFPKHRSEGPASSQVLTSAHPKEYYETSEKISSGSRLNKFVRRLYDMLCGEKNSGVVQWRRGLLVLLDTKLFAKQILPKYFNTRNFKTFRRQLNYYGFVHVRSYSNTGTKSTTALWVNQELATGNVEGQKNCMDLDTVASVLFLKRVEPCDSVKTSEGRRVRKELAMSTIEDDLGVSPQTIQLQQLYVLSEEQTKVDTKDMLFASSGPRRVELAFVEHHNWSHMATASAPECLLQEASLKTKQVGPHSVTTSGNSSCRFDSSNSDGAVTKPPTSSASAANLLLLLSSG